jgi:hypothetical protein
VVAGAVARVVEFVSTNQLARLNVAGPRGSGEPRGYGFALAVVSGVLEAVRPYRGIIELDERGESRRRP